MCLWISCIDPHSHPRAMRGDDVPLRKKNVPRGSDQSYVTNIEKLWLILFDKKVSILIKEQRQVAITLGSRVSKETHYLVFLIMVIIVKDIFLYFERSCLIINIH